MDTGISIAPYNHFEMTTPMFATTSGATGRTELPDDRLTSLLLRFYVRDMTFKTHEIDFLRQADLGRLATVQRDGTPQNSPVGFDSGRSTSRYACRRAVRNIAHHPKVAFVVDDIASRDPWRVRCLEIRGTAEQARSGRGAAATTWTRRSSGSRLGASSASASTTKRANRISWFPTFVTCRPGVAAARKGLRRRLPR